LSRVTVNIFSALSPPDAIYFMSKLSEPLKALINAAHARPNTIQAPKQIGSLYQKIAQEAASKNVGLPAWLTASVREIHVFGGSLQGKI
jgi:hypothetical protein